MFDYQLNVCQEPESLQMVGNMFAFHIYKQTACLVFPMILAIRGVVPMALLSLVELQDVLALKLHERIWAQDRP